MCGQPLEAALGHSCAGWAAASGFTVLTSPPQAKLRNGNKKEGKNAKQKQKAGRRSLEGVAGGEDAQDGGS